jgi:DNA/RNA endonuclease YhcR with UshA esterase domain
MKRCTKSMIAMLCILVFGAVLFASDIYAADEPQTVAGSVVAVKNAKGKITGVTIQTEKGETFKVVIRAGKGKELMNLVDKKVEAKGTVKEKKGLKTITVNEYKVLE